MTKEAIWKLSVHALWIGLISTCRCMYTTNSPTWDSIKSTELNKMKKKKRKTLELEIHLPPNHQAIHCSVEWSHNSLQQGNQTFQQQQALDPCQPCCSLMHCSVICWCYPYVVCREHVREDTTGYYEKLLFTRSPFQQALSAKSNQTMIGFSVFFYAALYMVWRRNQKLVPPQHTNDQLQDLKQSWLGLIIEWQ